MPLSRTRSGGVCKPSAVAALVTIAIANVKKRFRVEHAKARRGTNAKSRAERLKAQREADIEQRRLLRLKDADAVAQLIEEGTCPVRLTMRPLFPYVRNDTTPLDEKREAMRSTSWVFCPECDVATEGCNTWHTPLRLYAPEELGAGCRHVPGCAHNCEHHPERLRGTLTFKDLNALCPLTARAPGSLCHRLMLREPRLMFPRLGYSAHDVPVVADVPVPPAPPPSPPPPPPPTLPKCQRKLCLKPPTPDYVLTSTNVVCMDSERDYNLEPPLKRALRQKAHSHKNVRAMNDVIFYKHLRDHNLEPEEAHAEVLRRKRLIHAGQSDAYEPPEMGHLILGLLDGQPVVDPTPPPPPTNPWMTHCVEHGLVKALKVF